jgi:predicted enzyme related to lactoylglutathione lyase
MKETKTFTSFSVNDIEQAKDFYKGKLDLDPQEGMPGSVLMYKTGGDTSFMVYLKEDHAPASYTVLNFNVDNIETAVESLSGKGITFEPVEGTNEKGIAEMEGVKAAWLKDPAGNWLGLFQMA